LKEGDLVNLTEKETIYIDKVRDCYYELQSLMHQIKEEIEKYRQAYFDALED